VTIVVSILAVFLQLF